ncbi:MAG: protein-glutamate O-methyltransferase CheR [Pseudomonadota bacterium]|nr:protein-glutamate O-methyltransferase CheR [Pseudomonadota bacterium]
MITTSRPRATSAIDVLSLLLEERTGQRIDATRAWRIETALKPMLRDRGLESLEDLAALVASHGDRAIAKQVVDALLNQETSFFRDAAVLDLVTDAVLDMAEASPGRRLRLWSAGCSSGQEPLSLAMLFAERMAADGLPDIVATDVSDAAVARARAGRFSQFEIQRGLPVRRMVQWFDDTAGGEWIAKADLVRRISFRQMNLIADPLPIGRFDVILCRNVLLYLPADIRRGIFDRFAQVIRPGGLLVLGAGETVIGQTGAFRPSVRFRGLYEPAGTLAPKAV